MTNESLPQSAIYVEILKVDNYTTLSVNAVVIHRDSGLMGNGRTVDCGKKGNEAMIAGSVSE